MNLNTLGQKHGTDKADVYHQYNGKTYLDIYEKYFAGMKDRPLNILEIGVRNGCSHRLWKEYFPNSTIYGIDIDPNAARFAEDRIKIFIGSQSDEGLVKKVLLDAKEFDIIIDDGAHINSLMIESFRLLFPYVKRGGIYAIEDLANSYSGNFERECLTWPGMSLTKQSGVPLVNNRKDMDTFFFELIRTMDSLRGTVQNISFYPMMAFIQKID